MARELKEFFIRIFHGICFRFLLNDYNNFSIIPVSFWTPKTDFMIEEDLISSMKFLGLSNDNFHSLIKNKKKSWRFKNEFTFNYFGRKYFD